MGCDIHTCLQVKKGAKWETIATDIYDGRNYALFSVLAGVRGQEEPIAKPRGYPKGFLVDDENMIPVDGVLFFEPYWMGEFGHSWLTLEELNYKLGRDIYEIHELCITQDEMEYFISLRYLISKMIVLAYDQGYVDNFEDVRLVFGFDG